MTSTRPNALRNFLHSGFVDTSALVLDGDHTESNNAREAVKLHSPCISDSENYEQGLYDDSSPQTNDHEDELPIRQRNKRQRRLSLAGYSLRDLSYDDDDDDLYHKKPRVGARQSARSTRHMGTMQEKALHDIYRSDEEISSARSRAVGLREVFAHNPDMSAFSNHHMSTCQACSQSQHHGVLVYCQGCSFIYHHECLGNRSSRQHLVTKIGIDHFVLQCKHCISGVLKYDTSPDQGLCQECHVRGRSCQPFRSRKTSLQEQREREQNGMDPTTNVDLTLVDNSDNIMQRCTSCLRAWHAQHVRLQSFDHTWTCKDCRDAPGKISNLIAWRLSDPDLYGASLHYGLIPEDDKEYLIKYAGASYLRALWMPGAWVWSRTTMSARKAFAKREEAQHPKLTTKEAIPEDYLCADIILDVPDQDTGYAHIDEVDQALIKYKGLPYEEAVWEYKPQQDDSNQWQAFEEAYYEYVDRRQLRVPEQSRIASSIAALRCKPFSELKVQPSIITGGTLMPYQLAGVNWLHYKWFSKQSAILGDEMGLGKTIQVISFIGALIENVDCFPFLIVVPNSTCPNWRREIKQWAPTLRVAMYYGSKASRNMVEQYELFPNGSKSLHCHIVITSYEAAADEHTRRVFRYVNWQALVVDEGQRLKNDESNLYSALQGYKSPFKILLTGTPLQNSQRELFNLLQFLDKRCDAVTLEKQYSVLDSSKIEELHALIRPFFLRRTKRQVLTLPPMRQVVLPISMTTLQKKVCRTIMEKNADLMKSLIGGTASRPSERANLNNILMQLRKCLCHPFIYNRDIEERGLDPRQSYRNLIDASGKLMLLEKVLPMLRADGHRILIFSQFLDMLDIVEDCLTGMGMQYQRLDGNINSMEKQKRIDRFNAPNSTLFAFLLSTRAGGIGINLATADTVIILDPDFNPHQDLQALSRAHRMGQTKKVLCLQVVTVASAEERIMAIGRRKLALDKVLIQDIDDEDANPSDLMAILQHGVKELFKDNTDQDITYNAARLLPLLDRSAIKHSDDAPTADNRWSVAEAWETDSTANNVAHQNGTNVNIWDKILQNREHLAAKGATDKNKALGRGRRSKRTVDYAIFKPLDDIDGSDIALDMPKDAHHESDQEFHNDANGESDDADEEGDQKVDDESKDVKKREKQEKADQNEKKKDRQRKADVSMPTTQARKDASKQRSTTLSATKDQTTSTSNRGNRGRILFEFNPKGIKSTKKTAERRARAEQSEKNNKHNGVDDL